MRFLSPRGRARVLVWLSASLATSLSAQPLSRRTEIDFFRDVPSRNLKGLAARSDGRLVTGPVLSELTGDAPADLLWAIEPTGEPSKWLIGTGPDGKIFEITLDAAKSAFASRELIKLDEPHVFSLARLPDGAILAGTSPKGALCLVRDGQLVARVSLPVDSIFDVLVIDAGTALVATGNPGRIYRVDLKTFAASAVTAEKITDATELATHGIVLFGEVRDRNIRRLARLADDRIVVGSAPKGNIYAFPSASAANTTPHAPVILQENREAEVTDLLPSSDGGFYALLTFAGSSGESRITPGKPVKESGDTLALLSPPPERFSGRSSLVWFPAKGFPETLASRNNTAFYRIARHGDLLLLTGGEQGEMLGYDITQRLALTFAGSISSQLSGLAAVPTQAGRFLVLRNNAPGFALLDFAAKAPREAETRRIDLGVPALLGALRFNRLRDLPDQQVSIEIKTSNGSDEVEGWSPWVSLKSGDGGWSAAEQRGRFIKLRVSLPAEVAATAQADKAGLFHLPQNRRPQLQDFQLLTANYGLIPAPEPTPPLVVSLGQLINTGQKDDDAKQKSAFLGSQVVPTPGAQVVFWNVVDPDGDNVLCTFSLRRDGDAAWTDLALNSREPYVQFDAAHLPDGVYFTRIVATETDPRPTAERLTVTFETDDLLIDHTAPEILDASTRREGDRFIVTVRGRDALSLLHGFEAVFNHGLRDQTEQPADGIRDGREETFVLELPVARVAGATSVEVTLYDAVGNAASKRLSFTP